MASQHWFHQSNPLIDSLPHYGSIPEISAALHYNPLSGLDLQRLSIVEKDEWLVGDKMPLVPTEVSLRAAMTIISMHRQSLRFRNPTLPSGRRYVDQAIENGRTVVDFLRTPMASGAAVLVIKGITGVAKSVTIKRTLKMLGEQVIFHSVNEHALWRSATQLNYLYVGMSHDGSRGGLLIQILLAVDCALGSTYSQDLPKRHRTIERLAGAVVALLHSLYLGVLVIDEIQSINLVRSEHAELMQMFLLSLINSGIPVVLSGNPLGFTWLASLSQDASRMAERSTIYFHPCGAVGNPDDDEWHAVFKGVRNFYLLPEAPANEERCSAALKRRSGGIPRMALALWCIAQREVLFQGEGRLSAEDIEAVYDADGFDEIRPLCDGFALKDPLLLMRWRGKDVPVDFYARQWGKPLPAPTVSQMLPVEAIPVANSTSVPKRRNSTENVSAKSRLKAKETREANREEARRLLGDTLPAEDMRMDGLKIHALAALDQLMDSINAPRPPPKS